MDFPRGYTVGRGVSVVAPNTIGGTVNQNENEGKLR